MAEKFDPYHVWLAIPPADQPPNHYRLLGVPLFEDNVETIEQAADQRMGHLRNLQTGKHAALSQRLLNEVATARVSLLNLEKKAAYDQQLREQLGTQRLPPAPQPPVVVTDRNPAPRYTKRASSGGVSPSRWLVPGGIGAAALVALGLIAWAMQGPRDRVARDVPAASPAVASPDRAPGPGNPHERASTPTDDGPSPSEGSASTDESTDSGFRLPAPETSEEQSGSPLPGNAEAPPAAEPTQDDDPESDVDAQPSESPTPGEKQSDRHPVPPGSAQKTILAQVNQAFSIGEARQPAEKLELAGKLAALAEKSQKPEERFVLLRRAADLACDGGDAALMLDVVERIAGQYEVDLLHAQQAMLLRFAAASGKEQIAALVEASESVVDQLVADQRIELADELSAAVYRATLKQGNTDVRKAALARRREVQHLRDSLKQIEEARATLKANPDDAEAHATLARWHAFEQGDWKEGLRHLAKGDDPALRRLAEQELAFPQEVAAQVALADGWWEAAEKSTDDTKRALLSRAAHWYRQAQPELTSVVAKAKVARRLEEIGAASDAAGPEPLSGSQRLGPTLLEGALLVMPFERRTFRRQPDGVFVADLSGRGNHGKLFGATFVAKGPVGGALQFDSADDSILLPSLYDQLTKKLPSLSIAAWVWSATTRCAVFFDVGRPSRCDVNCRTENGRVYFRVPPGHEVSAPIESKKWYHVVGVWDGSQQRLYVDGKLADTESAGDSVLSAETIAAESCRIGTQAKSKYRRKRFFVGMLDEIAVFERALSEDEVARLYALGTSGKPLSSQVRP